MYHVFTCITIWYYNYNAGAFFVTNYKNSNRSKPSYKFFSYLIWFGVYIFYSNNESTRFCSTFYMSNITNYQFEIFGWTLLRSWIEYLLDSTVSECSTTRLPVLVNNSYGQPYLTGSGAWIIASTMLSLMVCLSCSCILKGTGSPGFSASRSIQESFKVFLRYTTPVTKFLNKSRNIVYYFYYPV